MGEEKLFSDIKLCAK